jgi:hypothetical protein
MCNVIINTIIILVYTANAVSCIIPITHGFFLSIQLTLAVWSVTSIGYYFAITDSMTIDFQWVDLAVLLAVGVLALFGVLCLPLIATAIGVGTAALLTSQTIMRYSHIDIVSPIVIFVTISAWVITGMVCRGWYQFITYTSVTYISALVGVFGLYHTMMGLDACENWFADDKLFIPWIVFVSVLVYKSFAFRMMTRVFHYNNVPDSPTHTSSRSGSR